MSNVKILEYDEWEKDLTLEQKYLLLPKSTLAQENLVKLSRIPSHLFSMLVPKIIFYNQTGNSESTKEYNNLFYRPRIFQTKKTTQKYQDRGDVVGLQRFEFVSNEMQGTIRLNQFFLTFEVSNPYMFHEGYTNRNGTNDYLQLMDFFKVKRESNKTFQAEFGWSIPAGIPQLSELVGLLGVTYPITLNCSNWKLNVDADRKTQVSIDGWAGVSANTLKKIFLGSSRSDAISKFIKASDDKAKEILSKMSKNKVVKDSNKVIEANYGFIGLNQKLYSEVQKAYGKMLDSLKPTFKLKEFFELALSDDIKKLSEDSGVDIIIVLGKYNSTKKGSGFKKCKTLKIGEVELSKDELRKNFFTINAKNPSKPITFDDFLQRITDTYLNVEKYLNGNDKIVVAGENEKAIIDINVKVNIIPYNNKIYIIIDDVNRYYSEVARVANTHGVSLKDKLKIAEDAEIPVVDLEGMNTIINYPMQLSTKMDEALFSSIAFRQYENEKANEDKIKSGDMNFPYSYYPIDAPFSMFGNFLFKPFQTIFLTWGSEVFDRFYIINKVSHKIENGTFQSSYDAKQLSY